jgi:hypothetical protein
MSSYIEFIKKNSFFIIIEKRYGEGEKDYFCHFEEAIATEKSLSQS